MRKALRRALLIGTPVVGLAMGTGSRALAATDAVDGKAGTGEQERRAIEEISLEALLKTRVDVARAPVSVTVLTAEDIQRSGAVSLAEVFRTVPGLDVLESFPGHVSVSARGTSEVFVNNMLVLVDGRRLEFQAAGVPFLDNAPVRMEDVKRIEVIKGPVGALYGTNALAGIINITTYSPDEVPGTFVSVAGGNRDTWNATLRRGGRVGPWAYKLVGGYTYTSSWSSLDPDDTTPSVGVRKGDLVGVLQRDFANEGRLTLESGVTHGDLASLTVVTTQTRFFTWPHFRAAYSRPDFRIQLTASPQFSELRERTGPVQPLTDHAFASTLSAERTLRPFSSSKLTAGGQVRYQRSTFTNIATPHDQVVGGLFVADEQTLVKDRLTFFGALGVSRHPEISPQVDGNAALVLSPAPDHALRVSVGRGHRDPSFSENFFNFRRRIGTREGYQTSNRDLDPEALMSFEAGYHGRLRAGGSQFNLALEGFTERFRHLIGTVTTIVPAGTLPQYPTVTAIQQYQNLEDRDGRGMEARLEWSYSALTLIGGYAYERFENVATGVEILKDVPRHKVTGAVLFQRGPWELGLWGHSVSKTVAEKGYFLLNPRLARRLAGWNITLEGFNATNDRHVETANERGVLGEKLGRTVLLSVNRTFGGGGGSTR